MQWWVLFLTAVLIWPLLCLRSKCSRLNSPWLRLTCAVLVEQWALVSYDGVCQPTNISEKPPHLSLRSLSMAKTLLRRLSIVIKEYCDHSEKTHICKRLIRTRLPTCHPTGLGFYQFLFCFSILNELSCLFSLSVLLGGIKILDSTSTFLLIRCKSKITRYGKSSIANNRANTSIQK